MGLLRRGVAGALVGSALLLGATVGGCDEGVTFDPPPPPEVGVAQPMRLNVKPPRAYPGRLEGTSIVEIRPRVNGTLETKTFEEGGVVEAGDELFTIEPDLYQAEYDRAKAEADRAEAASALAKVALDKTQEAFDQGAATDFELDTAKAEYDEAVATAAAARATERNAETNLGYTKIAAPISGRVSRSAKDPGNVVDPSDAEALTTIVSEQPMYVYFRVTEREVIRYIEANPQRGESDLPLRLELADGRVYDEIGQVDYAANEIDAQTGTLEIRATFPNEDDTLVSGYFVRVLSTLPAREAIVVPELAVVRDLSGSFVYKVGADGKAKRTPVETGELIGTVRVIDSGLDGNERVIISGLPRVRPGGEVKAVSESFDPPDAAYVDGEVPTPAPAPTPPADEEPATADADADGAAS